MLRIATALSASLMLFGACGRVQHSLEAIEVGAEVPMPDGADELPLLACSSEAVGSPAVHVRRSLSVGEEVMDLRGPGRICGSLVDGYGQALTDVSLRIVHVDEEFRVDARRVDPGEAWVTTEDGRRYAAVRSDGQGWFDVRRLAPGQYAVYAEAEESGRWKVLSDTPLELREAPYELRLHVDRLVVQIRQPDGGLAGFSPRAASATEADDGEWGLEPGSLYVGLRPVQGYEPPRPGFSWWAKKRSEDARWFATTDASRWEVHIPVDQPYWLLVAADDRAPVCRRVVLRRGQPRQTIELSVGPRVKPGRLSLAIHDPRGTRSVRGYGVTVMPERGPALGAFTFRFNTGLRSNDAVVPRIRLRLPPGIYDLGIRPIHEAEGALCGDGISDQVEPGPVERRITISADGQHKAIVRTPPQAMVIAYSPPDKQPWTLKVVALSSMAVLSEQEVSYNCAQGWVKVPTGNVRVEAHLAGRTLRPWTGVLTHGERLILHQDEGGFLAGGR